MIGVRCTLLAAVASLMLGGCALFFPQGQQGQGQGPGGGGANPAAAQANRRDSLDQMREQAKSGDAQAKLQWAAYLSGVLGSPDAKASYGEGVDWPALEAEALTMVDEVAASEDPQLALQGTGTKAQLLIATGKPAEAMAAFTELHDRAPSFDTAVSVLMVSAQTSQPLEDPVAFCQANRSLATTDEQLYGYMNACMQANQAAGGPTGLSESLPWATKKDFQVYARVDAAVIAEEQRLAAEDEARRRDEEARRQEQERQAAAAAASNPPPSGGSSAPSGPVVVSVTLRNRCRETVKLFFGDKPKFGSGTYSSLGGNSSTSKQMKEGDMIWVVDDGQNGLSSTTVSSNARTIEITESCTGMTVR